MPMALRSLEMVWAQVRTSSMDCISLAFLTSVEPIILRLTKLGSASALYKNGKLPLALFCFSKSAIQDVKPSLVPLSMSTPPMMRSLMCWSIVAFSWPKRPTAGIMSCATIAVSSRLANTLSTAASRSLFSFKKSCNSNWVWICTTSRLRTSFWGACAQLLKSNPMLRTLKICNFIFQR